MAARSCGPRRKAILPSALKTDDVEDFLTNIDANRGKGWCACIHGLLLRVPRYSLHRLSRGGSSRSIPLADIRPAEAGKRRLGASRKSRTEPNRTRSCAERRPAAPKNICSDQKLEVTLLRRTGGGVEQFLPVYLIRADCLLPLGRNQPIYEHLCGRQFCFPMFLRT